MTLQSMPSVPSFSDPSSSLVAHVPAIPANASATKPLEAPSTAIEPTVTAELRRPKSPVWGIEFDSINMDETIDAIDFLVGRKKACQVITANLNYVMLCQEHPVLTEVTQRAALTLCDGMPVLWRSRWTSVPLPERVAGADLIFRLCERAALRGHRIYFLGAEEGIAQAAADRLAKRYPGLSIAGVECPPFRKLSDVEHEAMCQRVCDAKTDILLVAFGQPKGELWIDENLDRLGGAVCIQLGASFDFVAGNCQRAPSWMQHLGLEWLHRSLRSPKRLLPRYAKNAWFLLKALRREILQATKP